jgi:hypothetical protein
MASENFSAEMLKAYYKQVRGGMREGSAFKPPMRRATPRANLSPDRGLCCAAQTWRGGCHASDRPAPPPDTARSQVFPAELMCRWLAYGTNSAAGAQQRLLRRREFSFTTGDDVYIRYLSYDDAKAFRKDLADKLPFKIDIGATYSAPPSEHKKFKVFQPVQRELIFDIDLTDYDFLSVDANKLETCDACWPVMAVAVKVMDRVLR